MDGVVSAGRQGNICWQVGGCLLVGGVVSASGWRGVCWQAGEYLLASGGMSTGRWGCLLVGGGVCWWVGVSVGGWGCLLVGGGVYPTTLRTAQSANNSGGLL